MGSDEKIIVSIYKDTGPNSIMGLRFSSKMQYAINHCISDYKDLPVQPPVEVDKVWMITKTETALIITCNNVEVLNYLFKDGSGSKCVTKWGGDIVEKIQFPKDKDTASDFYRAGKV